MANTTVDHQTRTQAVGELLDAGLHALAVSAILHMDPRIVTNLKRSKQRVKAKGSRIPTMIALARDGVKWKEVGVLLNTYLSVADDPYNSISADALIGATKIYQSIHSAMNEGVNQEWMLDANAAFAIAREYRDGILKRVSCSNCRIKFAHLIRDLNPSAPARCPVCNSKIAKKSC
ncbi:hypothetical protein ACF8FF_12825 [Pseudomonas sp. zjy_13]|uniref:hypothetical protein n=1 Tax=Pseudomonas sp. zjy_13 TaxID=3367263 RepID=UPI00370B5CE7